MQLSQFALSVPDFFWSAADALQALYNRVRQYVELEERAEVLSTRFDTLHGVLELARQTQEARYTARLEVRERKSFFSLFFPRSPSRESSFFPSHLSSFLPLSLSLKLSLSQTL